MKFRYMLLGVIVMSILGGVLGGVAGGVANMVGGIVGSNKNYDAVMATNRQNERLMREGWARDDMSTQRKVADMKAAGLNPLLAAGASSSSSAPVQMQSGSPGEAAKTAGYGVGTGLQNAVQNASTMMAIAQQKAQIEQTAAQTELIKAQTGTHVAESTARIEQLQSLGLTQAQARQIVDYDWNIAKDKDMPSNMPFGASGPSRFFNDIVAMIQNAQRDRKNGKSGSLGIGSILDFITSGKDASAASQVGKGVTDKSGDSVRAAINDVVSRADAKNTAAKAVAQHWSRGRQKVFNKGASNRRLRENLNRLRSQFR